MKKPAIIIDLDGTLCDSSHRKHHVEGPKKDWEAFYAGIADDKPNRNVLKLIHSNFFGTPFLWPFFVSGRPEKYRDITNSWILKNVGYLPADLLMRKNGDFRSDDIVKKEIYDHHIQPDYHVELAIDDRDRVVKMWRSLGIECWQVAEGNF